MKIALGALLGLAVTAALAQPAAPAPAASSAPSTRSAEPAVQRKVIEDDGVRIEELKVRGETRRVVVQSKVPGARPYEILPAQVGRDPAQDRSAGQRVWHLFSF